MAELLGEVEIKKSDLRKLKHLLLGAGLVISACSDESKEAQIEIRNILDVPIYLSDNPINYSLETRTGEIAAGETALAECIDYSEEHSDSSQIYVTRGDEEGYVGAFTAGTKEDRPIQQLDPSLDVLREQLPDC